MNFSFLTIYRYSNKSASLDLAITNDLSLLLNFGLASCFWIFLKSARTNIVKAFTRYIDKTRYI